MTDIPDEHPVRAFVIESGNLKDGFQKACEYIATLEQRVKRLTRAGNKVCFWATARDTQPGPNLQEALDTWTNTLIAEDEV